MLVGWLVDCMCVSVKNGVYGVWHMCVWCQCVIERTVDSFIDLSVVKVCLYVCMYSVVTVTAITIAAVIVAAVAAVSSSSGTHVHCSTVQ